jgi:hypothetical protein
MKLTNFTGLLAAAVFCFALSACGGGGSGGSSGGGSGAASPGEGEPSTTPPSYAASELDGLQIEYLAPSLAQFEMDYPELGNGTRDGKILAKCVLEFHQNKCYYQEQISPRGGMYEAPATNYVYRRTSGNIGALEVTLSRPANVKHGQIDFTAAGGGTTESPVAFRLAFDSENTCEVTYGSVTVNAVVRRLD